jgi:hypothetical protein
LDILDNAIPAIASLQQKMHILFSCLISNSI